MYQSVSYWTTCTMSDGYMKELGTFTSILALIKIHIRIIDLVIISLRHFNSWLYFGAFRYIFHVTEYIICRFLCTHSIQHFICIAVPRSSTICTCPNFLVWWPFSTFPLKGFRLFSLSVETKIWINSVVSFFALDETETEALNAHPAKTIVHIRTFQAQ